MKALGSETLLRLTQHPSDAMSPAWSPDGTQIAFHRMAGADTGIYVIPSLGGPERKLRSTRMPWRGFSKISWSPDGKWIAFAEELPVQETVVGMYLLSTETLEATQIPISPKCESEGHAGLLPQRRVSRILVFSKRERSRPVFLTHSGWSAEDDFIFSGFSKWINLVG